MMTREQVFDRLDERGAAQARVHFSGGNDSGGADSIVLTGAAGGEIAQQSSPISTLYSPSLALACTGDSKPSHRAKVKANLGKFPKPLEREGSQDANWTLNSTNYAIMDDLGCTIAAAG